METISATLFIITVIIGATEFLKRLNERDYRGAVIIAVAAVLGGLVGLVDVHIGLTDITVAEGILAGFGAVGVHTTITNR